MNCLYTEMVISGTVRLASGINECPEASLVVLISDFL